MTDGCAWVPDELSPQMARARIADARRNGLPAWLWPEIDAEAWRAALSDIERVTRRILTGESGAALVSTDAKTVGIAGYTSGMGPLLGYWIETGGLRASTAIKELFRLHLVHNRERQSRLAGVAHNILEALADRNIFPLVLKGMHTAFSYFPEPGVRPLSDIDVYVPSRLMPTAEQVLSSLGLRRTLRTRTPYACDWTLPSQRLEPHTLRYVHRDDPWSLDVQGTLDRRLMTGANIELDGLLAWGTRSDWPVSNRVGVLSQPLLALYLATHISQTLLNATMLRLVELVLVIRHDRSAGLLDWEKFLEGTTEIGGARFVYPALVLCEQLVPQTIPVEVLAVAKSDAPQNLRGVVERLTVAGAQPLDRHSVSERFMWARNWRECARQFMAEIVFDGRGRPLGQTLYSAGTKLWALRQSRYSA